MSTVSISDFVYAVELEGTGHHPASWRRADSRAEELFRPGYWIDLARMAERAGIAVLFIEDTFAIPPGGPEVRRGRLDATMLAARIAMDCRSIGLVPTATVTHTEPFHLSRAIATLDYVSRGRAGWAVGVSRTSAEADLFGRKDVQGEEALWAEAGEAVEVVTGLWDSWEDDAEIRDVATGRFVDRNRLHYLDFAGAYFAVRGPAVTPRPPQGRPPVVVRYDSAAALEVAARFADVVRVTADDPGGARRVAAEVRSAVLAAGRDADDISVLVDVEVLLSAGDARAELSELDDWLGAPYEPSSLCWVGTPAGLAGLLAELRAVPGLGGATLLPLALPAGLALLPACAIPHAPTLRDRFGLPHAANRFSMTTV